MSISNKRPTLGNNINRKTGGLLGRTSTSTRTKDLLADESIVVREPVDVQNASKDVCMSFQSFVIRSTPYDYPRIGKVPAVRYHSKISDMKIREKNEKLILDVYYDLEDAFGRKFYIKQSYPEGSQPFQGLATALVAAGVPDGATVDKGIGIEEILELDYITPNSDFASIVERKPYVAPSDIQDMEYDEGDDEEDLLEDD